MLKRRKQTNKAMGTNPLPNPLDAVRVDESLAPSRTKRTWEAIGITQPILMACEDMLNAPFDSHCNEGRNPLHAAAMLGRKDIARLLVASGVDVNSADATGQTPLHYAALCGSREVAEILLTNHADANVRNSVGGSPLHYAALFGSKEIAEMLLAHRADVNAVNNRGQTPLHTAAYRGCLDVLNVLLANGADVNAKDRQGNSPLQDAVTWEKEEVAELLRRHRV
jgi:ankyrin repeat protein